MTVIKKITQNMNLWIEKRYSDIYFLPTPNGYNLATQNNGFQILDNLNNDTANIFINYFKFNSGLNLGETRRPQIGSMIFLYNNEERIFLRISTIGDFNNRESLVLRIIYPLIDNLNLYRSNDLDILRNLVRRRGLMLFSGPTGSGKTTLIYHLARELAKSSMIMTIEDPVEIYEPLFLQTQVNLSADMSYEDILKASLRHRPDILIVGEIRDAISAHAAITAALSGHLVFSTIHARSVYGVIERLLDFGIDQAAINNCLNSICYQRIIPNLKQKLVTMTQVFDGFASDYNLNEKDLLNEWKSNMLTLLSNNEISRENYERFIYG